MKMKLETENEFVRGTVSGAISATAICLFSELFEAIGLAKHCWLYLAGQPIMNFNHGFFADCLRYPFTPRDRFLLGCDFRLSVFQGFYRPVLST